MHQTGQHSSAVLARREGPGLWLDDLLTAALHAAPTGLVILAPDRTVRMLTAGAAALLGIPPEAAEDGRPLHEILSRAPALAQDAAAALISALSHVEAEPVEILLTVSHPAGPRNLAVDIRAAGTHGWVISLDDVTRTRQTQDWLLEHASSDPITGLWNRHHFTLMLQDQLLQAHEPAVLLVGLQRLKHVNDTLGPDAGDTILRHATDRLSALLLDGDMLARFAGDEFAVALTRAGGRSALAAFAQDLAASLGKPYVIDGQPITLGIHAGIARAPLDGATADTLIAHASLALLETGTRGSAPVRFFEPILIESAQARRALEADLRLALGRGEFELHYQPQVDVFRGCVTGLEALIRWRSPTRGLVPPFEFIGLAEQIGLINDIGDWVLRQACRQAANWPDEITVAVNASPLQFETGHFARSVAEALAETGMPARRLEIEITESLLLRDTGTVMATLAALHAQGVRLVLDDFGTGYASLSQLSRFRFDKIKIDRSFVSPKDASLENSAIVRSIAALGRSLGIPTTAEGVETAKQLEQITADGCTSVQGYYFSRPVPFADVDQMLDRLHRPPVFQAA
jgi:diguanylate cyclase (GGDEF)-like protein